MEYHQSKQKGEMDLKLMLNEESQIVTTTNLEINLYIQDFLFKKTVGSPEKVRNY